MCILHSHRFFPTAWHNSSPPPLLNQSPSKQRYLYLHSHSPFLEVRQRHPHYLLLMRFTLTDGGLLATGGFLVDAFTCSTHHPLDQLLPSHESTQNVWLRPFPWHKSPEQTPFKPLGPSRPLEFSEKQQLFEVPLRASWTAPAISSARNLYPESNVSPENSYSPWQFLGSHSQSLSLKDAGCRFWISLAEEAMEALLPQWLQHSFWIYPLERESVI